MDTTEILLNNSYGNNTDPNAVDDADELSWDQLLLDDDSDIEMIE